MENETPKPVKPRFAEVCQKYNLDYQAMQEIADKAGLPKHVVDAMSTSVAVRRLHALKILAALSEHTGQTWTLDKVKVALYPTFADLHTVHQFDLTVLSTASCVSFDTISMLLSGEAVPIKEARSVLQAASKQTGQSYTVNNVDLQLPEGR